MCSATLQPPNPPPNVSCGHKGLVLLLSAQHPLGHPLSGTGQAEGASSAGDTGHHLIAVSSCGLRTRMGDTGPVRHPQPGHPLPPAATPGASHPPGGGTSGLQGARLGFTLLGPSHLPRGAPGTPGIPPLAAPLPHRRADLGVSPGASSFLPGLARSVSCHLAPVNNSPSLSPLFPCRYL